MTKTFAFRGQNEVVSEAISGQMDPLRALERAANAKPARPPRRLGRGRTLSSRETMCSRCKGCVASFNLDWKPFCDTCHSYEHEVRRLESLVQHYKNMLATGGPRGI